MITSVTLTTATQIQTLFPLTPQLSGSEQAVTTIFFCNISPTTSTNINMYVTPFSTPPSNSNLVLNSLPLPAGETYVFDAEKIILEYGEGISASASYGGIVVATLSTVQTS